MRLISSDLIPKSHPKVSYETQLYQYVAELLSLNSGASHFYAAHHIDDVSRGSVLGPKIV
jgi:hypothetical protein